MKLTKLVNNYVQYKQALGVRFQTDAYLLETLCTLVGPAKCLSEITPAIIAKFLVCASGSVTYWYRKFAVLEGFNRFLTAHGYTLVLPLPTIKPQRKREFVPYILNRYEVAKFFAAIPACCEGKIVAPNTARLVFLVLYGAGLRIGEVLSLKNKDVDLTEGLLMVRATKFYKTRLVPVAPPLQRELLLYHRWKSVQPSSKVDDAFFIDQKGRKLQDSQIRGAFENLRHHCRISKPEFGQRPRIHDFRHTFAVQRLLTGYRRGEDVQDLLPKLATYLGHASISSTQVYLTMTPDLLAEASKRFESHAFPEVPHES